MMTMMAVTMRQAGPTGDDNEEDNDDDDDDDCDDGMNGTDKGLLRRNAISFHSNYRFKLNGSRRLPLKKCTQ